MRPHHMKRLLPLLRTKTSALSLRTKLLSGAAAVVLVGATTTATVLAGSGKSQTTSTAATNQVQVKGVSTQTPAAAPPVKPATPTDANSATATTSAANAKPTSTTPTAKPTGTTPASTPVAAPKSPAPAPATTAAPKPKPTCPECGGEPAKTPTRVGALILSGSAITIPAGGLGDASLTARSDSGEAISIPYNTLSVNFGLPPIVTSPRPVGAYGPYHQAVQTFGFNASPDTALGTHTYKIVANGSNGGQYSGYVTVTIVAP